MQRSYIFTPEALKELLVHFSDGAIPLNGTVYGVHVSPLLQRMIGIEIESDEWEDASPLHIRYDGQKRLAAWKQDSGTSMDFEQRNDTPRLQ